MPFTLATQDGKMVGIEIFNSNIQNKSSQPTLLWFLAKDLKCQKYQLAKSKKNIHLTLLQCLGNRQNDKNATNNNNQQKINGH